MSPPADCTLFFVLRPGAAALQARLLVASLREVLPTHLPIHAFLPAGDAPIDSATRKLMAALKVEMRPLPPQPGPAADHPAAALLDAACQPFQTARAVALHTALLALSRPPLGQLQAVSAAAAPAAGLAAYRGGNGAALARFAAGDGAGPAAAHAAGAPQLPVFDPGVVAFDPSTSFAQDWRAITRAVLASDLPTAMKRPQPQRTALAVVMARLTAPVQRLERAWNHPLPAEQGVHLLAYPDVARLLDDPKVQGRLLDLHRKHARAGRDLLGTEVLQDLLSRLPDSARTPQPIPAPANAAKGAAARTTTPGPTPLARRAPSTPAADPQEPKDMTHSPRAAGPAKPAVATTEAASTDADPAEAERKREQAMRSVLKAADTLSLAPRARGPVAVVTLCKDRPEVVRSFVAQQLALGAEELRIYFDDPDDPALPWAQAQPRVVATPCTEAFWIERNHKTRPAARSISRPGRLPATPMPTATAAPTAGSASATSTNCSCRMSISRPCCPGSGPTASRSSLPWPKPSGCRAAPTAA